MRSTSISRPTPSMIVAIVALVMALGGTSYAAATLSGKTIKKRSVPADRIVNNALSSTQINESRLGTVPRSALARFAEQAGSAASAQRAGSATVADSAKSADTAKTADTAKSAGDAQTLVGRAPSAFMANNVRLVVGQSANIGNGLSAQAVASCNADEKAIGGGAAWYLTGGSGPTTADARISASMPEPDEPGTDTMTGWRAIGQNHSGGTRVLRVFVSCVKRSA